MIGKNPGQVHVFARTIPFERVLACEPVYRPMKFGLRFSMNARRPSI